MDKWANAVFDWADRRSAEMKIARVNLDWFAFVCLEDSVGKFEASVPRMPYIPKRNEPEEKWRDHIDKAIEKSVARRREERIRERNGIVRKGR